MRYVHNNWVAGRMRSLQCVRAYRIGSSCVVEGVKMWQTIVCSYAGVLVAYMCMFMHLCMCVSCAINPYQMACGTVTHRDIHNRFKGLSCRPVKSRRSFVRRNFAT